MRWLLKQYFKIYTSIIHILNKIGLFQRDIFLTINFVVGDKTSTLDGIMERMKAEKNNMLVSIIKSFQEMFEMYIRNYIKQ